MPEIPKVDTAARRWSSRPLRVAAALLLIGTSLWAVLSGQGHVSSDNAVVSAYTVSIRTPIAGVMSAVVARVGQPILVGAHVATVSDDMVDKSRQSELLGIAARADADNVAYQAERKTLLTLMNTLTKRTDEYNTAFSAYLSQQAQEAEAVLQTRNARRDQALRDVKRNAELTRAGWVSASDFEKFTTEALATSADAVAQNARLGYLRLRVEAARHGLSLDSGSNDVAYSAQRADEVAIHLAEIDRQIASDAAIVSDAQTRMAGEAHRIAALALADLASPATGMVWKVGVSDGERVPVGDTVVQVVDCTSAFIIADIPQDRFSDIVIGAMARLRLSGETSDRTGRVISVMGDSGLSADRNLAAIPGLQRDASATVRIEMAASDNTAGQCLVGRTARVLLPSAEGTGLVGRFLHRFF
jgi:multidrug resistance efflux pump